MEPIKYSPADAGCYVDGRWGQYGMSRVVRMAIAAGWQDNEASDLSIRHLLSMGPNGADYLNPDEFEALFDASIDAEAWLNEHCAPEGYSFGWHDGEFFLQADEWWQEESY